VKKNLKMHSPVMPEIRKKVVFYEKFKGSLVIWNIDLLN